MRTLRHPLSLSVYEWAEEGLGPVKVTQRDGAEGRFDRDGSWIDGELRHADAAMCRWIASGGPNPPDFDAFGRRFGQPPTPGSDSDDD